MISLERVFLTGFGDNSPAVYFTGAAVAAAQAFHAQMVLAGILRTGDTNVAGSFAADAASKDEVGYCCLALRF
jgi:hypothetical protein